MASTNDDALSPKQIKETLETLAEAVRLLAINAKHKASDPPIERAIQLAEEAKRLINPPS